MFGVVPYPGKTEVGKEVSYPNVFPGTPNLEFFYKGFITELVTLQPGAIAVQPTIRPENLVIKIRDNARFMSYPVGNARPTWFAESMGKQAARWFALQWFYAFGTGINVGTRNTRVARLPVAGEYTLTSSQGAYASRAALKAGLSTSSAVVSAITEIADKMVAEAEKDKNNNTVRANSAKELFGSAAGYMYRLFMGEYIGDVNPSADIVDGRYSTSPGGGSATPGGGSSSDNSECGCGGSTSGSGSDSGGIKILLGAAVLAGGWYWYRKSKGLPFF